MVNHVQMGSTTSLSSFACEPCGCIRGRSFRSDFCLDFAKQKVRARTCPSCLAEWLLPEIQNSEHLNNFLLGAEASKFPVCRQAYVRYNSMQGSAPLAWAPSCQCPSGNRGYKERHVYRKAGCPWWQFCRSLKWQQRPTQLRAISEELVARQAEPIQLNGSSHSGSTLELDDVSSIQAANSIPPCELQPGTTSVHGGERDGRPRVSDSLTTPIVQTATYTFQNTAEVIAYQEGRYGSYEYGRYGNPTTRTCEEKIRQLEGAEDCLVSSSGMNTATTMLLALVPAGGHIVTTTDCYRRTRQIIQTLLPKMGISATVIDPADLGQLERVLQQHDVSLFFSESPTNPYLRCVDVRRISQLCHAAGALVCIDSTFATPINQRALALGADIVIHSATKYLAGHNDILAGTHVAPCFMHPFHMPYTCQLHFKIPLTPKEEAIRGVDLGRSWTLAATCCLHPSSSAAFIQTLGS